MEIKNIINTDGVTDIAIIGKDNICNSILSKEKLRKSKANMNQNMAIMVIMVIMVTMAGIMVINSMVIIQKVIILKVIMDVMVKKEEVNHHQVQVLNI
jgi:hypothetical protein